MPLYLGLDLEVYPYNMSCLEAPSPYPYVLYDTHMCFKIGM